MLRGGNTKRTPLGPGTPACATLTQRFCPLWPTLNSGAALGTEVPSMLTRLSSETRSQHAGGLAASPWKNGDWAIRGVLWERKKAFFKKRSPR